MNCVVSERIHSLAIERANARRLHQSVVEIGQCKLISLSKVAGRKVQFQLDIAYDKAIFQEITENTQNVRERFVIGRMHLNIQPNKMRTCARQLKNNCEFIGRNGVVD